jgi:hypothetical protein
MTTMDDRDTDRLELLDRIRDRLPEVDVDQHSVEWTELPDGAEALVIDGGGFDGGPGCFLANAGDDVHVVGTLDPIVAGYVGCIVIGSDGTRRLARVVPDPLAQQKPD